MKSIWFDSCGNPADVLQLGEREQPVPGPGEVLVRMLASPINPSDLMYVRGNYTLNPQLPAAPGFEGVGVVEAHGGGLLGRIMLNKRVAVLNRHGGNWSESVCVPARQVIPLSEQLPLEQAATFFVNPATALILTVKLLQVPRGRWLLQTAAGSALGRMVIRLGRHFGFRTLNIVRSPQQADELKQMGADQVLVSSGEEADIQHLQNGIREALGGEPLQYAIDPVGGPLASALVPLLGMNGRLILYGTLSGAPISFSPRALLGVAGRVEGFWLGHYMEQLNLLSKLALVRQIKHLIVAGVLNTDRVAKFAQADYLAAIQHAEARGRESKAVLDFTAEPPAAPIPPSGSTDASA